MPKSVGKWVAVQFIKKHGGSVTNCGSNVVPWYRFADLTQAGKVDHLACRYMRIYKVPMLFEEYEKIVKRIAFDCVYPTQKFKVIDKLCGFAYLSSKKIVIKSHHDGVLYSEPLIAVARQMKYRERRGLAAKNRSTRVREMKDRLYEIAADLRDIKKLTSKLKEYSNENISNS